MRILIHGINFSPELTGIGKYSGEMAEWLAAQGHEVRVVTAPPYYPQWKVADGYVNGWRTQECRSGFNPTDVRRDSSRPALNNGSLVVYRCPLWVPSRPSGLKRLLHLASFALSSFPIMLRQIFWRPDVVWVVEPPLFCAPQAWLVARLSGAKAWLHIQDYEVDAAFELGLLKGALLRRFVSASERWLMRRFDRVSTISQRMLDRALTKGVATERAVLFPNWVEIKQEQGARYKEQADTRGYRTELGIAADTVVALYSGNMGGKQGLEIWHRRQNYRHKVQETRYKSRSPHFSLLLAP
jgi:colanic acid biosynthesis glycosyl transferase WcaI